MFGPEPKPKNQNPNPKWPTLIPDHPPALDGPWFGPEPRPAWWPTSANKLNSNSSKELPNRPMLPKDVKEQLKPNPSQPLRESKPPGSFGPSPRVQNPYKPDPEDPFWESKEFSKDSWPYIFSDRNKDPYWSHNDPYFQPDPWYPSNDPRNISPYDSTPFYTSNLPKKTNTFHDPEDPFNEDPGFGRPEDTVIPWPKDWPLYGIGSDDDLKTAPYYYDSAFDDGDNKLKRDMKVLNPF